MPACATSYKHGFGAAKDQLRNRLARIEGRVRGVERMVGGYGIDIVTQISAIQAALERSRTGSKDIADQGGGVVEGEQPCCHAAAGLSRSARASRGSRSCCPTADEGPVAALRSQGDASRPSRTPPSCEQRFIAPLIRGAPTEPETVLQGSRGGLVGSRARGQAHSPPPAPRAPLRARSAACNPRPADLKGRTNVVALGITTERGQDPARAV